jgi:hypothetical protein
LTGSHTYTVTFSTTGCSRGDTFQYSTPQPTPNPKLIVRKSIVGAPGKPASDFFFRVNQGPPIAFEADGENELTLAPGTYNVTEVQASGFTPTTDGCNDVTLSVTQQAPPLPVCTITNTAETVTPFTLRVQKVVVGSSEPPSKFSFQVNGGEPTPFTADGLNELTLPAGTYDVTEVPADGFTSRSAGCSGIVLRPRKPGSRPASSRTPRTSRRRRRSSRSASS